MPFFEIFLIFSGKGDLMEEGTVKDRVVSLCTKEGITATELEKKLLLGNGAIDKWKNSRPRASTAAKIAEYFNVSIEYILFGEEPASKTKLVLTDSQEIDVIDMLRKLDVVNRYFAIGQIAALLRNQEDENGLHIADPEDR